MILANESLKVARLHCLVLKNDRIRVESQVAALKAALREVQLDLENCKAACQQAHETAGSWSSILQEESARYALPLVDRNASRDLSEETEHEDWEVASLSEDGSDNSETF
jgi:hypothetical protein